MVLFRREFSFCDSLYLWEVRLASFVHFLYIQLHFIEQWIIELLSAFVNQIVIDIVYSIWIYEIVLEHQLVAENERKRKLQTNGTRSFAYTVRPIVHTSTTIQQLHFCNTSELRFTKLQAIYIVLRSRLEQYPWTVPRGISPLPQQTVGPKTPRPEGALLAQLARPLPLLCVYIWAILNR